MLDTVEYILSLKERFPYTTITYQPYRPYRGSLEYEKIKAKGYPVWEPQTLEEWAEKVNFYDGYKNSVWLDEENKLIIGWDNAPHHTELKTFPDHKHVGKKAFPSPKVKLEHVLESIRNFMK